MSTTGKDDRGVAATLPSTSLDLTQRAAAADIEGSSPPLAGIRKATDLCSAPPGARDTQRSSVPLSSEPGSIPKRFGIEILRDAIMKVMAGGVFVPADLDLPRTVDPDITSLRDRLVTLSPQQVRC